MSRKKNKEPPPKEGEYIFAFEWIDKLLTEIEKDTKGKEENEESK